MESDFQMILKNKSLFFKNKSKEGYSIKKTDYETLQTIIVEKGTKKIKVRTHPTLKNTQTNKIKKIICDSCNKEIESNICKIVIMRNKDDCPSLSHYHFFFPCWDFEKISKEFKNFTLERVGVSIPEDVFMSKTAIMDLQNNFDYWK